MPVLQSLPDGAPPPWPWLSAPPAVMGVLNVTPDSFSDGGLHASAAAAVDAAAAMVAAGADIVDVGGESTRPGARPLPPGAELERAVPVIEAIRARWPVLVSVDTGDAAVMHAAAAAGAGLVNDVRSLHGPGSFEAAMALGLPVCLTHMRGEPGTMNRDPVYADVVAEVAEALAADAARCVAGGLAREAVLVDPGFGFGKRPEHNMALLASLRRFGAGGHPVVAGLSRKVVGDPARRLPPARRIGSSVAMALAAARRGAAVLRVHDVEATVDALAAMRLLGVDAEHGRTDS